MKNVAIIGLCVGLLGCGDRKPIGGPCVHTSDCNAGLICNATKHCASTDPGSGSTTGATTGATSTTGSTTGPTVTPKPVIAVNQITGNVFVGERRSFTVTGQNAGDTLAWSVAAPGAAVATAGTTATITVTFDKPGPWDIEAAATNASGTTKFTSSVTVSDPTFYIAADGHVVGLKGSAATPTTLSAAATDAIAAALLPSGTDLVFGSRLVAGGRIDTLVSRDAAGTETTVKAMTSWINRAGCGLGNGGAGSATCYFTPGKITDSADHRYVAYMAIKTASASLPSSDADHWATPGLVFVWDKQTALGTTNPQLVVAEKFGSSPSGPTGPPTPLYVDGSYDVIDVAIDRDASRLFVSRWDTGATRSTASFMSYGASPTLALTQVDLDPGAGTGLSHARVLHPRFAAGGRVVYSVYAESGGDREALAAYVSGSDFSSPRALTLPNTLQSSAFYAIHLGESLATSCATVPGATYAHFNSGYDYDVSSDGNQLVVTRVALRYPCNGDPGAYLQFVYLVNVTSSTIRELTPVLDVTGNSGGTALLVGAPRFIAEDRQVVFFTKSTTGGATVEAYVVNLDPDFPNPRKVLGAGIPAGFTPAASKPYGFFSGCSASGDVSWLAAGVGLLAYRMTRRRRT